MTKPMSYWWQLADDSDGVVKMDSKTYAELTGVVGGRVTHLYGRFIEIIDETRPVPRNLVELVGPP